MLTDGGDTGVIAVAVLVPLAYLLGTFPSATMVARTGGHDVLAEGSGNPGASNVVRLMGWRAGLLVMVLDFAKGAVAAGAGLALWGRGGAWILGVGAVLGHVFPATRRFRGGKGVATAGGALVVLYPLVVVILAVEWLLVARVLKRASVASLVAVVAFPVIVGLWGYPWPEVVALSALALLVVVRHAANLRRLVHGDEPTLRTPPRDGPAA